MKNALAALSFVGFGLVSSAAQAQGPQYVADFIVKTDAGEHKYHAEPESPVVIPVSASWTCVANTYAASPGHSFAGSK